MELTLNVRNSLEFFIVGITKEFHDRLITAHNTDNYSDELREELKEMGIDRNSIVAVAGDDMRGPIFNNMSLRNVVPVTKIGSKHSYYCYSGLDHTIKHANDVLHEDVSSAVKCALTRIRDPKYALIAFRGTKKPDWIVKHHKEIKIKDYVKQHREKIIPVESK